MVISAFIVAAAQILVGPASSGAPFAELQPAIDFAAPGDTILVLPGTYAPFDLDKSLILIGSGPDSTVIVGAPGTAVAGGVCAAIHGVPAGTRASLSGMSFSATVPSQLPVESNALLTVTDCAGAIQLHDIAVAWTNGLFDPFFTSPQVVVADCDFVQIDGSTIGSPGGPGGISLEILSSTVWIAGSQIGMGQGPSYSHAIQAVTSELLVTTSTIYGSNTEVANAGFCDGVGPPNPVDAICGDGGQGIRLLDSDLRLHGGPGMTVGGGLFTGQAIAPDCTCGGLQGASIWVDSDSSAILFGQVNLDGLAQVLGSGVLVNWTVSATSLVVSPNAGDIGDQLLATVRSAPGAPVFLYGSLPGESLTQLAGFDPGIALSLSALVFLGSGVSPVSGELEFPVLLPNAPILAGSLLATQAVAVGSIKSTSNASLVRINF